MQVVGCCQSELSKFVQQNIINHHHDKAGLDKAYLRVLDHGQLERVTGEGGVQVGFYCPTHTLYHNQINIRCCCNTLWGQLQGQTGLELQLIGPGDLICNTCTVKYIQRIWWRLDMCRSTLYFEVMMQLQSAQATMLITSCQKHACIANSIFVILAKHQQWADGQ